MIETLYHKWLRVPHDLHIGHDSGPKKSKATVVLIHGLASSHIMWRPVIKHLADNPDIRIISVDLLGFGKSPKPIWQTYSAHIQSRSLAITMRKLRVKGPVLIVGHSLGALVAIQFAKRYRRRVSSLLLCSPPFYKPPNKVVSKLAVIPAMPQADDIYRMIYKYSRGKTELAKKMVGVIKRARLMDEGFMIDDATMPAIVSSLEMSIENQTSLQDAEQLHVPLFILYGLLDPFVVKRNLRQLEKRTNHVSIQTVVASHEIPASKLYVKKVSSSVNVIIKQMTHDR